YLFLCDRKRDMVISGGVNIYPAEIEAVLLGLPGVRDCAVFGIPDAEFGEAVMAVVEPPPGAAALPRISPATSCRNRLRSAAACRARIPEKSSSAGCAIPTGPQPADK